MIVLLGRGHIDLEAVEDIIKRCYEYGRSIELVDEIDYGVDTNARHGMTPSADKLGTVILSRQARKYGYEHVLPHNWTEFKPFVDMIESQSKTVHTSWFNILPIGTSLSEHTHHLNKNATSSIVYYPSVKANHAAIEIVEQGVWIPINVVSGDWIEFTTDTIHRVPPNTGEDRISIVFDVKKVD